MPVQTLAWPVAAENVHPANAGTMVALGLFILGSVWIGLLANRAMRSGTFMKGFFLGNRGLGAWALALTATVQSGGTFMGFPSLVYSHGWVVALWICGYMVVPITGFGVLGKRLAQVSRRTGAITVPDLFRARFNSPGLGLTTSLLIMFYMCFMMVAQFKAGAVVMKHAWPGSDAGSMTDEMPAFKLEARAIERLAARGAPPEVMARLAPLVEVGFESESAFGKALDQTIDAASAGPWRAEIVKAAEQLDWRYFIGLGIFTVTVVGYTLLGGFLAAVWTDLFQSVMMLVGVVLLVVLVVGQAGSVESATLAAVAQTGPEFAFGPGYDPKHEGRQFLPLGLAFSFFWVWVFSGLASPASMVRVMAGKSTEVIRKSIYLLSVYNVFIYLPLILICICGRKLIPDLPAGQTDSIVPQLSILATRQLPGGALVAGLILAAPFGAVMATVSSYLVVIASGLVRDVYQRMINPNAGTHQLKLVSYYVMVAIGVMAVAANIKPVAYLQAIVVFSGTGAAATFCVPALMLAYWRRATMPGTLAAMAAGAGTVITLYVLGFNGFDKQLIGQVTSFRPYYLCQLDPLIWGLANSAACGILVSLLTSPPPAADVARLFDAAPTTSQTAP